MAGLVDELLVVMRSEKKEYENILNLNDAKREAIISREVERLEEITPNEEFFSSNLKNLENKRERILKDMAAVTGHDDEIFTVDRVIRVLDNNEEEQKALVEARSALVSAAKDLKFWNDQNQALLKQALEMVEFDLTLFRSLKQAPQTANYNQNAYNTGDLLGDSGFDTKQ